MFLFGMGYRSSCIIHTINENSWNYSHLKLGCRTSDMFEMRMHIVEYVTLCMVGRQNMTGQMVNWNEILAVIFFELNISIMISDGL